MKRLKKILKNGLKRFVQILFPFEETEDSEYGFYLEKKCLTRIVKLSVIIAFLMFNATTISIFGKNPHIPIPTGLSVSRFMIVMFLATYGYFSFKEKIYRDCFRSCDFLGVLDTSDEEIKDIVYPNRNTEAIKSVNEVIETAEETLKDEIGETDYIKVKSALKDAERKLTNKFEGEEYNA